MDAQLKRGVLDVCVLSVLSRGDSYGYMIIKNAPKQLELTESTLYPVLKRLESAGYVNEYSVAFNSRLRRYYQITQEGSARIREFLEEWEQLAAVYDYIREVPGLE